MANPDYFTVAELQALPDCSAFTEAKILAAAAHFTTIVEREIGEPFIPRTFVETLDGSSTDSLVLSQANIRSLTTITVGGATVDVSTVRSGSGVLRYASTTGAASGSTWPRGVGNVVVTYVAGMYAACPGDVKDAVMQATRDRLISQSSENVIDARRTSMTDDLGGTVNYVLPGEKRPTGYPELDALIASYLRTTPSYGFA